MDDRYCHHPFEFFCFLDIVEESQKLLYLLYHLLRACIEWHPLMQCLRHDLQNSLLPVRCHTARLLGNKCHRVTLVQQSQLPGRVRTGLRIQEHTTLQHIPVEIGYQRTDITGSKRTIGCLILFLTIFNKFLHANGEIHVIPLVD